MDDSYRRDEVTNTISSWALRHAHHTPNAVGFVFVSSNPAVADVRLSWAAVGAAVRRVATLLRAQGAKDRAHVALLMTNSPSLYISLLAIAALRCTAVPLSPLLSPATVALLASNAQCAVLLHDDRIHLPADCTNVFRSVVQTSCVNNAIFEQEGSPEIPEVSTVRNTDLCHIVFSSGTTGTPKGICISQETRYRYGALYSSAFSINPSSVIMHAGSLVFNGAYVTMIPALLVGATFVLMEAFNAGRWLESAHRYAVTHCIAVPTVIMQVIHYAKFSEEHVKALRVMVSVGAPLPQSAKEEVERKLPGRLCELYGTSEGFSTVALNAELREMPNTVGRPLAHTIMKIVDDKGNEVPTGTVGEITGQGPLCCSGYYRNPKLTAQLFDSNGLMRTGDLGYVDKRGYLFIAGRAKDMLISGGANIYPVDIEAVAARHPAVLEVSVFGIASDKFGEQPVAAVSLRPDAAPVTSKQLVQWINERVNSKMERVVDVMILQHEEFPRNVAGKVLKSDLSTMYTSRKSKL